MSGVFIISAPSGSGKSTLVEKILQTVPGLEFSISYTTRAPRGNERNGREYFFVSQEEFKEMVGRDEFLEYAEVFRVPGNYYGTARRFLREARAKDRDLLLDIDVQGAEQIKGKLPEAVSIFVLPPDRKTLEQRLRKRGEDDEQKIQRRLDAATREIENYSKYDYILVNADLRESTESLRSVLLAERWKRAKGPRSEADNQILALARQSCLANMRERVQPILDSFRRRDAVPDSV